ncbi:MAG: DEAD/DEAH box helicase family protein [Fulvivirga sp.]|uniref:DEAD/DEAH box helicase n=1 Tax=Fulvivirga sp. TaxID=1931237 RepID=UPI0032EB7671
MIFQHLTKPKLQQLIGTSVLDRLERIIPVIKGEATDPNEIYRKDTLVKIFSSFSNSSLFKNKEFVSELLFTTPEEIVDQICLATNNSVQNITFEQKVDALVSQGWNDFDFCSKFLTVAGLPESFLPVKQEPFIAEEDCPPPQAPFKTLKGYQTGIFQESIELINILNSRFIIQMPTGSGKTRTSMEIIADVLCKKPEGSIVFWLAHSEELCEQAVQCFKEVWEHIGNKTVKLFRVWDKGKLSFTFPESAFMVGGFQKLHSLLRRNQVPFDHLRKRIDLLVIDEAHKVLAPTYLEVTRALMGENTRVIGLTATPGRHIDDLEENKRLSDFFLNKIITISSPDNKSVIQYLRERKVLSKAVFDPLVTNINYELDDKQKKHLETFYDFPDGLLKTIGSDDVRNLEIIKRIDKEYTQGKPQIIFFACSLEQSKFICSLLVYMGYKAAHVDGGTVMPMRQKLIDDFKNGKIQIICNFGVLSTGFDAPKTDVVFIARPTRSIVLYSQMIGRGLRGPAIGGTEKCKIITVRDNITGLPDEDDIFDYFDEYFEN